MGLDEEKKELAIEFNITIACPVCNEMNDTVYIPHHKETFKCKKCGQQNMIMMSFIAMKDNPEGVRTMMMDSKRFEKRELNRNIGGVMKHNNPKEKPDSGSV